MRRAAMNSNGVSTSAQAQPASFERRLDDALPGIRAARELHDQESDVLRQAPSDYHPTGQGVVVAAEQLHSGQRRSRHIAQS